MATAFLFPGQGTQKIGIGKEVFGAFNNLVQEANDFLGYDITELCLTDPEEKLDKTEYAQPAIYIVNTLYFLQIIEENQNPSYLLGHSLGEYNALCSAGVFGFIEGLKLIKKRAMLMANASIGSMAAIIGLSLDKVNSILNKSGYKSIDIANINSPNQIVISGPKSDIEEIRLVFEDAGADSYVVLNVSGAFHSRYMHQAQIEYAEYLDNFNFVMPKITVISNVTARSYERDQIKDNLAKQITYPVRWAESIEHLLIKDPDIEFYEIGGGTTMLNLVKDIKLKKKLIAK